MPSASRFQSLKEPFLPYVGVKAGSDAATVAVDIVVVIWVDAVGVGEFKVDGLLLPGARRANRTAAKARTSAATI